jgi:O-antigen/teichoic acid export membrane protein
METLRTLATSTPDDFPLKLALFLGGLLVLLFLLALAVRWWGRLYQEKGDQAGLVRRVFKNSLTPTITNVINRVVDFAFGIVVLHYLGVEGNGYYAIAALLVARYLTTISDFGMGTLTTREVARDPAQANRYLGNTTLVRWALSALSFPLVAAIIAGYQLTANPLQPPAQAALWLLSFSLFPADLAAGISSLFYARERMEVPAFASLLTNVLKVFAGIGVLAAGWGVVGLATSAVGVTLVNAALFLYLQWKLLFRPRLELDLRLLRWMLPEAFPLLLNNLLLLVFFRFDTFILQPYGGAHAVGAYDAAYKLPNAATEIPFYITMALFPLLSRFAVENRERFAQTYHLALKFLLLLAFPAAMLTCVLATEVIYLLGGSEFLPDSAVALAILIWFLPLSYVNAVTQYALIALDRQRTITVAFLIAAVFNIAVNMLAIPRYGAYGYVPASVVTILTEAVLFIPFWLIVRREIGRLPLLSLAWRPALATVVMGVPMVWLHAQGYWAAALAVGLVLYGGMIWLLRPFTLEERAVLRRMLPGKTRQGDPKTR